jgi:2-keto-3-deoxy-L-rhamnonate aldolase RhmA
MARCILDRLKEGKIVRVMTLGPLVTPKWIEIAGQLPDLEGVWIDQEHCAIPQAQLEMLLLACRAAGLDGFARVAPTDYAAIMRPYEAGCSGVMAAQIRSVEQVQQVVAWSQYPPLGVRGLYMGNAECQYGAADPAWQVQQSACRRWLAIQIETREAVECIDQIAGIAGVDWLFVGPADLACSLGVPGQLLHPKCLEALDRVATACRQANKPWGTLSRSAEHAQACRQRGCQLFSIYGDIDAVRHGLRALDDHFRTVLGPATEKWV